MATLFDSIPLRNTPLQVPTATQFADVPDSQNPVNTMMPDSEAVKGLRRGIDGLLYGTEAATGQLFRASPFNLAQPQGDGAYVTDHQAGDRLLENARLGMEASARNNAASNPTWASVHGGNDALRYGIGKVTEGAPALIPAMAGGLVGRALGGALGAHVGSAAAFMPQMTGDEALHLNDPNNVAAREMGHGEKLLRSLGTAAVQSAAMGATPAVMGRTFLAPEARSLTQTLLTRPVVNTAGMGAGMAAGDVVGQGSQMLYDPNKQFDPEQTKEAFAGGVAMGAGMAAAHAVPDTLMSKAAQGVDAARPLVETARDNLTPEAGQKLYDSIVNGVKEYLPENVNEAAAAVGNKAAEVAAHGQAAAEALGEAIPPAIDAGVKAVKEGAQSVKAAFDDGLRRSVEPEPVSHAVADIVAKANGETERPMPPRVLSADEQEKADFEANVEANVRGAKNSNISADPVNREVKKVFGSSQLRQALREAAVSDVVIDGIAKDAQRRIQMRKLTGPGIEKVADDEATALINKYGITSAVVRERVKNALLIAMEPFRGVVARERKRMEKTIQDSNDIPMSDEFKGSVKRAITSMVRDSGVKDFSPQESKALIGALTRMVHGIAEGKPAKKGEVPYAQRALPVAAALIKHFGSAAHTALNHVVDAALLEYNPKKFGLTDAQKTREAKAMARLSRLTDTNSLIEKVAAGIGPHLHPQAIIRAAGLPDSKATPMKAASLMLREMSEALAKERHVSAAEDAAGRTSSRMKVLQDSLKKATDRAYELVDKKHSDPTVMARNKADVEEALSTIDQINAEIERHRAANTRFASTELFSKFVKHGLLKGGTREEQQKAFHQLQELFHTYERSPERMDKPEHSRGEGQMRPKGESIEDLNDHEAAQEEADSLAYPKNGGAPENAPLNADGTEVTPPVGDKTTGAEQALGVQRVGTMGATYYGTERLHPTADKYKLDAPMSNHASADYPFGQIRDEHVGVGHTVHAESGHRVAAGKEVSVLDWADDIVKEHGGDREAYLKEAMERLVEHDALREKTLRGIIDSKALVTNSKGQSPAEQRKQAKDDLYWIGRRAELAKEMRTQEDGGAKFFGDTKGGEKSIARGFKYYKTQQESAENLRLGADELKMFSQRTNEVDPRDNETRAQFIQRMKLRDDPRMRETDKGTKTIAPFPDSVYEKSIMPVEMADGTTMYVDVARLVNDVMRRHQKGDVGVSLQQAFHEVMGAIMTGEGVKQQEGKVPFSGSFLKDAGFGERYKEADRRGIFSKDQVIYRESDVGKRGMRGDKRAVTYGQVSGGLDIDPKTGAWVNDNYARNSEGALERKLPGSLLTPQTASALMPKGKERRIVGEGMLTDAEGGKHNLDLHEVLKRQLERAGNDAEEMLRSGDIPPDYARDLMYEALKELQDKNGLTFERGTNVFDNEVLWKKIYGDETYATTWGQLRKGIATIESNIEKGFAFGSKENPRAPHNIDEARQAHDAERARKLEEDVALGKQTAAERKARTEQASEGSVDVNAVFRQQRSQLKDTAPFSAVAGRVGVKEGGAGVESIKESKEHVTLDNKELLKAKRQLESLEDARSEATTGEFNRRNPITGKLIDESVEPNAAQSAMKAASPTGKASDAPLFDVSTSGSIPPDAKRGTLLHPKGRIDVASGLYSDSHRAALERVDKAGEHGAAGPQYPTSDSLETRRDHYDLPEPGRPMTAEERAAQRDQIEAAKAGAKPLTVADQPTARESRTLDTGETPTPEYLSVAQRKALIEAGMPEAEKPVVSPRAEPENLTSGLYDPTTSKEARGLADLVAASQNETLKAAYEQVRNASERNARGLEVAGDSDAGVKFMEKMREASLGPSRNRPQLVQWLKRYELPPADFSHLSNSFNAATMAERLNSEPFSMAKHPAEIAKLTPAEKAALRKALENIDLVDHNAGAKLVDGLPTKAPKEMKVPLTVTTGRGTFTKETPKLLRAANDFVKTIDDYSLAEIESYASKIRPEMRDALADRLDSMSDVSPDVVAAVRGAPFSDIKVDRTNTREIDDATMATFQKEVQDHVDSLVKGLKATLTRERIGGEGEDKAEQYHPSASPEATAQMLVSIYGPDVPGAVNHGTWHHIEEVLKSMGKDGDYILDQLHKSTRTKMMDEMLKKEYAEYPEALAQMEDNSERAAYAFQSFMKDGKLPLPLEARGWWEHIKHWFMDLVGITRGDQKAEAFFKYIADSGMVRDGIDNPFATLRALGETKTDAYINKTKEALKPLKKVFDVVVSSSTDRVLAHKNDALNEIVRRTGGLSGKGGMQNELGRRVNEFNNQLAATMRAATPEQQKLRSTYDPLLSRIDTYMKEAGVSDGMRQAVRERVSSFDADNVAKHMEEFMVDLVRYGGLPGKKADTARIIASKIADRGFYFDPDLKLFDGHPDINAKWENGDVSTQVGNLILQAAKLTERQRAFGERTKEAPMGVEVQKLLKQAEATGASQEAMADIKGYMDGFAGRQDVALSPEMKKFVGGLLFAQNVALLPFSVVAQLMEPMQLAMRKNDMSHLFSSTWRGIKDFPRMFDWYENGYNKDYWERFTNLAGAGADRAVNSGFAQLANGMRSRGLTGKLNDMFFRYNGMEGMDRSMHIEATKHAVEFLKDHARGIDPKHSERFLTELGVTKDDVLKAIKTEYDAQDKKHYETLELDDKLRSAISQYVNEAMAHPDAGSNPMWFNDPRMALLSQMKRFTFGFSKYVNDRNMKEILDHGNYQVLLPMAAAIPWSLLMIDPLKHVVRGSEMVASHGFLDSLMRGMELSGQNDKMQFLMDAERQARFGGSGIASLLGPTASSIDGLFRMGRGVKGSDPGTGALGLVDDALVYGMRAAFYVK